MQNEQAIAAIDTVQRLLCERWNVAELDGEPAAAVAAVREALATGDGLEASVDALRATLAERQLYRWADGVAAALAELADAIEGGDIDAGAELRRLTVPVLKERLTALDIAIPDGAKKDDLVALLLEAGATQSPEQPPE